MKKLTRIIAATLCLGTAVQFCGCFSTQNSLSDKTVQISNKLQTEEKSTPLTTIPEGYLNFCVNIYNKLPQLEDNKNNLFSPLSLYMALSILCEGAAGSTQQCLLDVLGLSKEELRNFNLFLYEKFGEEKYNEIVAIANSIWMRDDELLTVNKEFLSFNATYYGANIFKSSFDSTTVKDINKWVSDNTFNLIKKVIEKINDTTMLIIINTVAINSEWVKKFEYYSDINFTSKSGKTQKKDCMRRVLTSYSKSENAVAFKYSLRGGMYFMGVLPNENTPNYALTNDELTQLLTNEIYEEKVDETTYRLDVITALPAFKYDYSAPLKDTLISAGLAELFDDNLCNLSAMGSYNNYPLFVSDVRQETTIEVTKTGVRAAAATIIEIDAAESCPPSETKTVYIELDRPFYYLICDRSLNLPIFIGCVNTID